MDTSRGDTPPDTGPPGPAPPGPLPSPIGPPAPYEYRPNEWELGDDITVAIETHQDALAWGRTRLVWAHSGVEPLLECDEGYLARSVESAVKLLTFLVLLTEQCRLYTESDICSALNCYSQVKSLRPLFLQPYADKNLRYQLYLNALVEISKAAETLYSTFDRYLAMRSGHRNSRNRLYLPTSPQMVVENIQSIIKNSRESEPPQSPDVIPTRLQEMDAVQRSDNDPVCGVVGNIAHHSSVSVHGFTDDLGFEEADTSPGKGVDLVLGNEGNDSSHTAAVVAISQDSVGGSTLNEPGTSAYDLAQDDCTAVHRHSSLHSVLEPLTLSETSKDTYSGATFETLLTKCPNRIEYPEGEVTKFGAGESYRPSAHARPRSPQGDTFRSDRDRSPRRDRARSPPISDSYHPGSYSPF